MAILPVELHEGLYQVRFADRLVPLCNGGAPVAALAPGWHADFVVTGLAPIHLLELHHDDGQRSTWFLDERLDRVGGELEELSPQHRALLAAAHAPFAGDVWSSLLVDPIPPLSGEGGDAELQRLNPRTRQALQTLGGAASPEIVWSSIADIPFGDVVACDGGRSLIPEHLRALLGFPLQDQLLAGMAAGGLCFPSPVTGRPTWHVHSIYVDPMVVLYRCVDTDNGLVFCIVAAGHHCEIVGVLIPLLRRAFTFSHVQKHFADTICQGLAARIDGALRRSEPVLRPYLQAPTKGFAAFLWGNGFHIGHHLWNELTGLERLVGALPTEALPQIVVQGDPGAGEAYGAIEALFPELASQVRRGVRNDDELLAFALPQRLQLVHVTGEHVSAALRHRIMAHARGQAALVNDRATIHGLTQAGVPIVVLGLRVENRTLADFPAFATRVIEHLLARLGRVVVVLDGHNGRADGLAGGNYPSFSESRAASPPEEVEAEIARTLAATFAGTGAQIVDLVGRPIAAGLLWLEAAAFFVAPWGAGLAKYRWVANKPGLILSSRWVLTNKGDLHIYDDARTMEAPTPVLFIEPQDVFDLGDEPVLVQVFEPHHPMYYNFLPSMNRVYGLIDRLVQPAAQAPAMAVPA